MKYQKNRAMKQSEETKQHKDAKYKSSTTQKLNNEKKYREQENENDVNFEIQSCSRLLL